MDDSESPPPGYAYAELPEDIQPNLRPLAPRPAYPDFTLPQDLPLAPGPPPTPFHSYSPLLQQTSAPRTPARKASASSLLSQFLPGVSTVHKMDQRSSRKVSGSMDQPIYAESNSTSPPHSQTQCQTPPNRPAQYVNLVDEKEEGTTPGKLDDEQIEYVKPSRSRLRTRKPNMSLKALENIENTRKPSRKKTAPGIGLADMQMTPVVSKRNAIRQEIASKTAAYRNQFFVEKKDLLLPLLPAQHNYVKKLVEREEQMTPEERAQLPSITPYVEIEKQPKGIKATMKPYQLSGLSFMMYLHHNVHINPFPA